MPKNTTMTFEPGWYPYPGDPDGTVRRWNGSSWIGYPTELPSDKPELLVADMMQAQSHVRRPLARNLPITPAAILAALGLVVTIVLAVNVLRELIEVLQNFSNLPGEKRAVVQAINDPTHYPATRRFGISIFVGGAFFLLWLWQAHRNLGRPIKFSKAGFLSWLLLGWSVTLMRWIFGPIISMMFELVEQSGSGPDAGKIAPVGAIAWWVLWLFPSYVMIPTLLLLWAGGNGVSIQVLVFIIVCLTAYIVSLLIALKLVVQITVVQRRRLALAR